METSTPTFLIKKILFDHLPDKIALIEKVIDENGFGNTVEQIIANVSELLHPTGKAETNPQEIAAYAYKAIKEINQQVIKIEDPEARNEVKGLLSDFFNAVIKEISLKKPTLSEQINKEITKKYFKTAF